MTAYILTFTLYFIIIIAIVYVSYRMTDNMSDYVLGGRRLNGLVAAFGVGASDMGSWLLMALPGAIFLYGLNQIWLPIGLSIGAFINWQYVSERLRIYTELAGDALTIPAYFAHRFHDRSDIMRSLTAIITARRAMIHTLRRGSQAVRRSDLPSARPSVMRAAAKRGLTTNTPSAGRCSRRAARRRCSSARPARRWAPSSGGRGGRAGQCSGAKTRGVVRVVVDDDAILP